MKIELKNVKHAKFMSEETDCFEAAVWIDGKLEGHVSNEGHGGSNMYRPWELETKLTTYAKTLPNMKSKYFPEGLEMDADLVIGELFEKYTAEKQLKSLLKKSLVYVRDGKLLSRKMNPNQMMTIAAANPESLRKHVGAEKVLNVVPFEEALNTYISMTEVA